MKQITDPLAQHYDLHDSQMLKLEIKQSKLPFSGMGLFAIQKIQQFQIIAQYYGSVMGSQKSMDKEFNLEDKMIQVDKQYCIISRGPASRANDIVRWEPNNYNSELFKVLRKKQSFPKHSGFKHNAKISLEQKQKAFLKATQIILPGQEIFIDYGFQYWDFFYKYHLKTNGQ